MPKQWEDVRSRLGSRHVSMLAGTPSAGERIISMHRVKKTAMVARATMRIALGMAIIGVWMVLRKTSRPPKSRRQLRAQKKVRNTSVLCLFPRSTAGVAFGFSGRCNTMTCTQPLNAKPLTADACASSKRSQPWSASISHRVWYSMV